MGIEKRRERERQRRREEIIEAGFVVARDCGWSSFSMEKVAAQAEIGRATIYSYFDSLDDLVATLGALALSELEAELAQVDSVSLALDIPVRLSQRDSARFELLFPQTRDPRSQMNSPELLQVQKQARELMGRLGRIARNQAATLPTNLQDYEAFVTGVSMAGATVPALKASTTLRHRFHDFCLKEVAEKAK